MASHLQHLFFILLLLTVNHFLPSQTTQFNPQFLLKLTKDPQTHQYTTHLLVGSIPTKLLFHLSGHSLWLNCPPSSRNLVPHISLQCSMATKPNTLSYSNCNCKVPLLNPINGETGFGDLVEDTVTVASNSPSFLTVDKFLFSCSPEYLVKGLVAGAKGVLGLGRSKIAFRSQMVNNFGFLRKFTLCLSSSDGFITSGVGIAKYLSYTPLNLAHDAEGYYINVSSIKINGRRLAVGGQPIGAVEISSTAPYTLIKSTLYEFFKKAFVTAASWMNMTEVSPVAPFGVCFRSQTAVPEVELVLQSELVKWRIHGRNLMVEVSDSVMCLGFVDGGLGMNGSMILGGHQLEDRVMELDWGTGMMGFSNSLLIEGNSCSNIRHLVSTPMESL